jgi:hypothetical protein
MAVLGGMLLGGAVDGLTSADFYRPGHQLVFEAIEAVRAEGRAAEAIAVRDEMRRRGTLSRIGGAPYLHTLAGAVPTAVNAGFYAAIVRELATRRKFIEGAERIRQLALNPGADLADVRALAASLAREAPEGQDARGRKLVLTRAFDIEPEPVVWAWEDDSGGRIPAGSLGLAAGREGTGKSSFLIWLSARITTGTLPGSLFGAPRGVIYVAVEDSWKYTIVPRLMAAGADLKLVYRAEVQAVQGDTVSLSLPADNGLLERAINENDVALVALDPLMSAISDHLDTHVNRQVRTALDPLARIADRTRAVFAGIAHFSKAANTDASSLITGSGAFKDVSRFIFAFATDADDGSKVITQTKNSLGHSDLPSLAYRIIEATVPTGKGDARVGRFVLDGPSAKSVQDILSVGTGSDQTEKVRAQDYLEKALAGGPKLVTDIEEESWVAHTISKRTLDRARQKLKIKARKVGAVWWIALPIHEGDLNDLQPETAKDAKDAKPGNVGNHAKDAKPALPGDVGTVGILPDAETWGPGTYGEAAS